MKPGVEQRSPDERLRRLAVEVMEPDVREPLGAYLFWNDEPGAELARHVEQSVFFEEFGETPEIFAREAGPYEAASLFICVIDHLRRLPAGVMRVVVPSPAGFKSLNDIEAVWGESAETLIERTGMGLELQRTWDVATLAVLPDYRKLATKGLVAMGLYQTVTRAALASGVRWLVAIFDMPAYRLLRWKLGMVFAGYTGIGPRPYVGSSASLPAWCDLCETDVRMAERDPDMHALLFEGVGLEAALRPADLSRFAALHGRLRAAGE